MAITAIRHGEPIEGLRDGPQPGWYGVYGEFVYPDAIINITNWHRSTFNPPGRLDMTVYVLPHGAHIDMERVHKLMCLSVEEFWVHFDSGKIKPL